jgi:hypothetical protein
MAESLGVSKTALDQMVRSHGLSKKNQSAKKLLRGRINRRCDRLYRLGYSDTQIAQRIGATRWAVAWWRTSRNFPLRGFTKQSLRLRSESSQKRFKKSAETTRRASIARKSLDPEVKSGDDPVMAAALAACSNLSNWIDGSDFVSIAWEAASDEYGRGIRDIGRLIVAAERAIARFESSVTSYGPSIDAMREGSGFEVPDVSIGEEIEVDDVA